MIVDHGLEALELRPMLLWKRGRIRMWWKLMLRRPMMCGYYAIQSFWPCSLLQGPGRPSFRAYDIAGWRQLKHLIITVNNAYLEINTTKKRETNPELVLAFFKICYYRIQKCRLVFDKIKVQVQVGLRH